MSSVGVHGMLVVGEETVYLSHLPMFMSPHDFQIVLEVKLLRGDKDVGGEYAADRRARGTNIYTLNPTEEFDVTELDPSGGAPSRTSFEGALFRGHFERGGTPLIADLSVHIEKVVHFQHLDPRPGGAAPEYFFFGKGSELFLAHDILGPPDFDQVLVVRGGANYTDEQLQNGIPISFRSEDLPNGPPPVRLREGSQVFGADQLHGLHPPTSVEVDRELYLETQDLAHHHNM